MFMLRDHQMVVVLVMGLNNYGKQQSLLIRWVSSSSWILWAIQLDVGLVLADPALRSWKCFLFSHLLSNK